MDENCHAVKSAADSDAKVIKAVGLGNFRCFLGSEVDEDLKGMEWAGPRESKHGSEHLERPRCLLMVVQKLGA